MIRFHVFTVVLLWIFAPAFGGTVPKVDEIIRRLIERSESLETVQARNSFAYQRISTVDYLDEDDGSVKKKAVRLYQIAPENGEPVTKLISINGRPATDKAESRRSKAREAGDKSRTLDFSEDLLSRFAYRYLREEEFGGRLMWVLAFSPREGAESDGFFDRLLNAMTGVLWIDQEDYQLAKADVRIGKKVSFFGGIAGAIDRMDLTIIQRRLEPAVWLGEAVSLDFAGRKLFSPVRFRCFETCSDFQKIPDAGLALGAAGE